ncbi:hypothetical protein DL93DRAFT_2231837 [Clavulina sp. PMI_390]|nr:hypothetical protein DL93DRAFT_2231837 [Clavulina sp. PMI_390]
MQSTRRHAPINTTSNARLSSSGEFSRDMLQEMEQIFSNDREIHEISHCQPSSGRQPITSSTAHTEIQQPEPLLPTPLLRRSDTTTSTATIVPPYGSLHLSLHQACTYVDEQDTLRSASIVCSECYAERSGPVTHRFVVLELHREGHKVIWLRLDRRREQDSFWRFLVNGGSTKAKDEAIFSANKEDLVGKASRENEKVFAHPPNLRELCRLLEIIIEELATYRIWPENCWLFCSLIQQHLGGYFVRGGPSHAPLSTAIRTRIFPRVWDAGSASIYRRSGVETPRAQVQVASSSTSHIGENSARVQRSFLSTQSLPRPVLSQLLTFATEPTAVGNDSLLPELASFPSPLTLISSCVHEANRGVAYDSRGLQQGVVNIRIYCPRAQRYCEGASPELTGKMYELKSKNMLVNMRAKAQLDQALDLAPSIRITSSTSQEMRSHATKFLDLIDKIGLFLGDLPERKQKEDALLFRLEAVSLQRTLFITTPLRSQRELARLLWNLSIVLHRLNYDDDACTIDEEALTIRRECYRSHPDAERPLLSAHLHLYSIHLYNSQRDERYGEAVAACEEAVFLRRQLYDLDPQKHMEPLAKSLQNLSAFLISADRFDDASIVGKEAVMLRRIFLRASGMVEEAQVVQDEYTELERSMN